MGRTLATANQIILTEMREFGDFRRALRKEDQQAFDLLFAGAKKHTAAISLAAHALPFEAVLLAMLIEEGKRNAQLAQRVERLEGLLKNGH